MILAAELLCHHSEAIRTVETKVSPACRDAAALTSHGHFMLRVPSLTFLASHHQEVGSVGERDLTIPPVLACSALESNTH